MKLAALSFPSHDAFIDQSLVRHQRPRLLTLVRDEGAGAAHAIGEDTHVGLQAVDLAGVDGDMSSGHDNYLLQCCDFIG